MATSFIKNLLKQKLEEEPVTEEEHGFKPHPSPKLQDFLVFHTQDDWGVTPEVLTNSWLSVPSDILNRKEAIVNISLMKG